MKKSSLLYILAGDVIVVGALAVVLITNSKSKEPSSSHANRSSKNSSSTSVDMSPSTEGTFECLQPKDDGPHTLECAWGLRTDDGKVYELHIDDPNPLISVATGSRIRVTGMITEAASTKYDTIGAIRVEKTEQL